MTLLLVLDRGTRPPSGLVQRRWAFLVAAHRGIEPTLLGLDERLRLRCAFALDTIDVTTTSAAVMAKRVFLNRPSLLLSSNAGVGLAAFSAKARIREIIQTSPKRSSHKTQKMLEGV
jgi:hypothetical protein